MENFDGTKIPKFKKEENIELKHEKISKYYMNMKP